MLLPGLFWFKVFVHEIKRVDVQNLTKTKNICVVPNFDVTVIISDQKRRSKRLDFEWALLI